MGVREDKKSHPTPGGSAGGGRERGWEPAGFSAQAVP